MRANLRVPAIVAAAVLAGVTACGTSSDETLRSPVAAPAEPTTTVTAPPTTVAEPVTTSAEPSTAVDETTVATPDETTTGLSVSAADEQTSPTTLPGEPFDGSLRAGTIAHVAGVALGEVFVVHTLPGDDQPVAASLPPLTPLVLTGNGWLFEDQSLWWEVTAGDVTAWIEGFSLVYLGPPQDVTATIVSALGAVPTAPTMRELGKIVTDADPQDPPPTVVLVAELTDGLTSQVVYDVFPDEAFGDDVARGSRLRVTGRQVSVGDLPATGLRSSVVFELVSVEARTLCSRGADSATGFCV